MSDPEFAQAEGEKAIQAFVTAAGSAEGKLDEAKYIVFQTSMIANEKAKGQFVDEREESMKVEYAVINALSEGDGVSKEEWTAAMGVMMTKWMECKAAAGL